MRYQVQVAVKVESNGADSALSLVEDAASYVNRDGRFPLLRGIEVDRDSVTEVQDETVEVRPEEQAIVAEFLRQYRAGR